MANRNQAGQPMYLGGDSIYDIYLGDHQISEMYLGEDLVYSSGPFIGLKTTPHRFSFNETELVQSLKVKSSEQWSLTTPAWLTASVATGDTGETIVTLSATTQTAQTSGDIVITSQNYSAIVPTNYTLLRFVHSQNMANSTTGSSLDTGIVPDITTYGILKGRYVGYSTGSYLVGYLGSDSNDWRFFRIVEPTNIDAYMDVGNSRLRNNAFWPVVLDEDFDIEFGNCYMKNRLTDVLVSGTPWTSDTLPTNKTAKLELGVMWVESLQLYKQGNLVFDGVADKQNGQYGIYDSVSNTFLTSNSFNIVGEYYLKPQE